MKNFGYYYVIRIQYLGFRYSGWQIQPGQRTIEERLHKTLSYLHPNITFKILGAGRTDAKVSSLDGAFELFLQKPIQNLTLFKTKFNKNLPADIKISAISEVNSSFNIIKEVSIKEYFYLFSFGIKAHPYSAAFLKNYQEELDLEKMKIAASLFNGEHDFTCYTSGLKEKSVSVRTIESCTIEENDLLTANFFPEKTYALRVKGKGFMRYQIRMMMGALVEVGKNELSLHQIKSSLLPNSTLKLKTIAPGSGLHLNLLKF